MENVGTKLVENEKLLSHIFLPKPKIFNVANYQSVDGLEDTYSIPITQWKKFRRECYDWWGGVFNLTNDYGIKVDVKLVTEKYYCGFRFHKPESSYIQMFKVNPRDEFDRMRKEALQKDENIKEIQNNYNILNELISRKGTPSSDFESHLLSVVGDGYSAMNLLCFGKNPAVPFPVNEYLFHYGQQKNLHPWDLADAGMLSVHAAEEFTMLESTIDSDEKRDRLE